MQDVAWRLGRRVCLLKGCEQTFRPWHPLGRYCSSNCRAAARRWRQRTANRRYRSSEQGKCRRRAQACRYRERIRQRQAADSELGQRWRGLSPPEKSLRILVAGDLAVTSRSPRPLARPCRSSVVPVVVRLYVACCFANDGGNGSWGSTRKSAGETTIPGSWRRFRVTHIGHSARLGLLSRHFARRKRVPGKEHEKRPFFMTDRTTGLAAGRSSPASAWSGSMNDCTAIGWRSRKSRSAWPNRWSVTVKSRRS